MYVVWNWMVLW